MGEKIKKNEEFGLENVKSVESDVSQKLKQNYERSETTEGNQQIKTDEKQTIQKENGDDREVLIGNDLEKIKKVKEGFSTRKRKILNKLLK